MTRAIGDVRRWAVTAARAARLYRSTGLATAFGPREALRIGRDMKRAQRRGGLAVIHAHAVAEPNRLAIVSPTRGLTYVALDARINRLTHALHRLGVQSGDRVGLFLKNGHEYLELQLALSAIGVTGVLIGYRLKADEVAYVLAHSGAVVLFAHESLVPVAREAIERGCPDASLRVGLERLVSTGAVDGALDYEALLARELDGSPASPSGRASGGIMIYTSGTTGRGKGARRDYRKIGFVPILAMLEALPLRRDDRHLCVCPLYHSLASMFVAPVLAIGGCVVVVDHFDPEDVLRTIERERITSMLVVPTMLQRMLALPPEVLARYDTSSLRWIMSGAAPLPTDVARAVESRFGALLFNLYGATETGLVTLARPGEHTARPGTVGRALDGNQLRLLDETGRDVAVGEIGELYVRNGMLMDGYHANDEATREATRDGYVSVGDLARRDGDGHYYIVDRKTDMVISGGVNVYPWEIEQRLRQHPAVRDVAVVGVPDAKWGESLIAWVVPAPGIACDASTLIEFVREGLADYKRPRQIVFVDELPRNPTGKVLKRELRQRWSTSPVRSAL